VGTGDRRRRERDIQSARPPGDWRPLDWQTILLWPAVSAGNADGDAAQYHPGLHPQGGQRSRAPKPTGTHHAQYRRMRSSLRIHCSGLLVSTRFPGQNEHRRIASARHPVKIALYANQHRLHYACRTVEGIRQSRALSAVPTCAWPQITTLCEAVANRLLSHAIVPNGGSGISPFPRAITQRA
jgi:hypothetical protein